MCPAFSLQARSFARWLAGSAISLQELRTGTYASYALENSRLILVLLL